MYAVTIGTFDGVHQGHKYILNKTIQLAKEKNLTPIAIMLKYPIGKYFNGFDGLIYESQSRKKMIEQMGIKTEIIKMEDVWNITHEQYLQELLNRKIKLLVCGEDFRFGRGALGNVRYLLTEGKEKGLEVEVLHDLKKYGKRVSSTLIRSNIKKGNIKKANEMLEKNWFVQGHVYKDRQVGRTLGFPTANIDIRENEDIIFPKYGIYIVKGYIEGYDKPYWGISSVGLRPTFFENKKMPKVETYFLDFDDNIYGKKIKVEFYDYIRPSIKFDNVHDLINQMKKDETYTLKTIKDL